MAGDLRSRVLDATFAEVDDNGLAGLTVEAVASRAGSSRATVYRHFPGGRDELIETTLRREVGRFFEALEADLAPTADGADVADPADPAEVVEVVDLVAALVREAHRLLGEHRVFQRLLEDEAEAIAPPLATVYPMIHDALVAHLVTVLDPVDAVDGMDVVDPGIEGAADHAARMILSYVGTTGAWDLTDAADVAALVRHRILPGIVTDVTPDDPGH